jgi:hypothetical protein
MKNTLPALTLSLLSLACGGSPEPSAETGTAESKSAMMCTNCDFPPEPYYGTDEVGDTCGAARTISGTGNSDEINTSTDQDAWKFTSDSAYHNYTVNVAPPTGSASVDCKAYYLNSSGTWSLLANDQYANASNCKLSFTSSSVRTYCIKVYGINSYASSLQISTIVQGLGSQ